MNRTNLKLRNKRLEPMESDFTSAELKALREQRDGLNNALLSLLDSGDVIPAFIHTALPGTPPLPYQLPHEAEAEFLASVSEKARAIRNDLLAKITNLRDDHDIHLRNDQFPDEWRNKWSENAAFRYSEMQAHMAAGGCLWNNDAYRWLLAMRVTLSAYDITLKEFAA